MTAIIIFTVVIVKRSSCSDPGREQHSSGGNGKMQPKNLSFSQPCALSLFPQDKPTQSTWRNRPRKGDSPCHLLLWLIENLLSWLPNPGQGENLPSTQTAHQAKCQGGPPPPTPAHSHTSCYWGVNTSLKGSSSSFQTMYTPNSL